MAGDPATCTTVRVDSEAEVLALVSRSLHPGAGILISCLGSGVDYGNLVIEVNTQSNCNLRALEHIGFAVGGASIEQVLNAVEYWLPAQQKIPSLKWAVE
ncbi:hypothetical protein V8J88_21415 [Massilia sp. W12]|uniref:hypothetical protein n=1 Tax=Massilia sp. W12 TaxID=3126507 RepID=UPI0030D3FABF